MHAYFHTLAVAPAWFTGTIGAAFGAIFASFFGVVGERVPRHETLGGHSHCVCGAPLGAANIPIFGWLLTRGHARCCGAKIPVRYLIVELGLASAWAALAAVHMTWWLRVAGLLVSAGLALSISWVHPDPASSEKPAE
jgi:leader peptidase (prepilin peptidase)/N-methyltransferase